MTDAASSSTPSTPLITSSKDLQDAKSTSIPLPDRSRNAKAQARHRAKRKAYIEQLESTVADLKAALARAVGEDGDSRIQQLTHENNQLRSQVQSLKTQVDHLTAASHTRKLTPPMSTSIPTIPLNSEDDNPGLSKKRRLSDESTDGHLHLGSAMSFNDQQALRSASVSSGLHPYHQHSSSMSSLGLGLAPIKAPPIIQQHHFAINVGSSPQSSQFSNTGNPARSMFNLNVGLPPPPQYNGSHLTRPSASGSPSLHTPLSGINGPPTPSPSTPSYPLRRSPDPRSLPSFSMGMGLLPTPTSAGRDSNNMVRSSFMSQVDSTPSSANAYDQAFMSSSSSSIFPRSSPYEPYTTNVLSTSPPTSSSSLSSHPPSPYSPPSPRLSASSSSSRSSGDVGYLGLPSGRGSQSQLGYSSVRTTFPNDSNSTSGSGSFDWSIGLSQEPSFGNGSGNSAPATNGLYGQSGASFPFPRVIDASASSASLDGQWSMSTSTTNTSDTDMGLGLGLGEQMKPQAQHSQ